MDVELTVKGDIEALKLGPDDTLIVSVDRNLNHEQAAEMRAQLERHLGATRFLIATPGVEFKVAGRGEEPAGV